MRTIIRFLAVIALALSPVWGVQTVEAASSHAPERYPVWPSALYQGCSSALQNGELATVNCGSGGFLLTQFNSGYDCNEIDLAVSGLQGGPFTAIATAQSGSVNNTITIDGDGDYFLRFPFQLVNNIVTFQITAGQAGGLMTLLITSAPCSVDSPTPTVNPSSTATNTPVPVTGTPTPIPTHTPLPSGHSTFTATATPTGTVPTASPTASPTGTPDTTTACGGPDFPLLNCPWHDGGMSASGPAAPEWRQSTYLHGNCFYSFNVVGIAFNGPIAAEDPPFAGNEDSCVQSVIPGATGTLWVSYRLSYIDGVPNSVKFCVSTGCSSDLDSVHCPATEATDCTISVGTVTSGVSTDFTVRMNGPNGSGYYEAVVIDLPFVSSTGDTPTPAPSSSPTATATVNPATATAQANQTATAIAADFTPTPPPIPGAMSTNIPTATECPGGCAVTQLTRIPGLSTRVTVDTSPFSPFLSLSLARSSCAAFGYAQIPYPVIHGTPALGSTTPLSVTWTVPVTHDWDNTEPYSNTAIEPCAMNEIPTYIWDFTYWLSVLGCGIVFIMWLIGFVGRLSGDETING